MDDGLAQLSDFWRRAPQPELGRAIALLRQQFRTRRAFIDCMAELSGEVVQADDSLVYRWERGEVNPGTRYRRMLAQVCADQLATMDAENRRAFLQRLIGFAGGGLLSRNLVADPVRLVTASDYSRIDVALLEELEVQGSCFDALFFATQPANLLPAVQDYFKDVQRVLAACPSNHLLTSVLHIAARAATLCGHLAFRAGMRREATICMSLAQEYAEEIDDRWLRAHTLLALRALCSGVGGSRHASPTRALMLTEEAASLLGADAPPLLRAEVLACRAEDLAMNGEESACLRSLDEADRSMAQVSSSSQPGGGLSRYMRGYRVDNWRASSAIVMGRSADAIPILELLVASTDPRKALPYTGALTDLGAAHALQGEMERSCDILRTVLEISSAHGLPQRLHRVTRTRDKYLARWSDARPVRELDDRLTPFRRI